MLHHHSFSPHSISRQETVATCPDRLAKRSKARLVAKLRGARERKRRDTGQKVEGRPSYIEERPETVQLAFELASKRVSLRKIAAALADAGHVTAKGRPYSHTAVEAMIKQASTSARQR